MKMTHGSIDNLKKQLDNIRILGEYQIHKGVYMNFGISEMISFMYDDIMVINPFTDECDMFNVNPITYYKELFMNSDFMKKIKENTDMKKYLNTEIIVFKNNNKIFEGWSYDFLDENEYKQEIEEIVFMALERGAVIKNEYIIIKKEEE